MLVRVAEYYWTSGILESLVRILLEPWKYPLDFLCCVALQIEALR
jgi:hypothetical protein